MNKFSIKIKSYLSFLSLTAFTRVLKLSSPIHLYWWSSHNNTLFIGNLGWDPPPTKANILHLNNISTMPIPPSNSRRKYYYFIGKLIPLLNVSLNGYVLYILKPFYVPHAKHPWSWFKPIYRISSFFMFIFFSIYFLIIITIYI